MKRSLFITCMLASTLGVSALAQTATPEAPSAPGAVSTAPAGPTKVAVILFQPAVVQTNEGQRNLAQMRTKFDPKQNQLKQANDEVETLKKQLQTSGATLSETERESRQRTIDEKQKALQRNAEDAQNDFNSEMNEMYQGLAQKFYNVLQTYAQQNGYTVVLDASQGQGGQAPVLWAADSTNITEPVVQAYNAKSGVPAQPGASSGAAPSGRTTVPNRAPSTTTPRSPSSTTPRTPR